MSPSTPPLPTIRTTSPGDTDARAEEMVENGLRSDPSEAPAYALSTNTVLPWIATPIEPALVATARSPRNEILSTPSHIAKIVFWLAPEGLLKPVGPLIATASFWAIWNALSVGRMLTAMLPAEMPPTLLNSNRLIVPWRSVSVSVCVSTIQFPWPVNLDDATEGLGVEPEVVDAARDAVAVAVERRAVDVQDRVGAGDFRVGASPSGPYPPSVTPP